MIDDGFRLSRAINDAIGSLRRRFPALLTIALIGAAISVVATFGGERVNEAGFPAYDWIFFGMSLLSGAVGGFIHAAMLQIVLSDLDSRPTDLIGALRVGARFTLAMFGLTIVMIFGVGLGTILLFIPGLILLVAWSLATPAMVAERLGVFESLGRSRQLTRGSRWKLFAVGLVALALFFGSALVLVPMASAVGVMAAAAVEALTSVIFALIYAPAVASAYIEARRVREGTPVDHLAEVFA